MTISQSIYRLGRYDRVVTFAAPHKIWLCEDCKQTTILKVDDRCLCEYHVKRLALSMDMVPPSTKQDFIELGTVVEPADFV